ncbi:MAG: hypothetical protein BEN18_03570 [Epulopiscium sp. Nuni2H_MBin001]|nr:MAG: hypothetical protein BEN18_03570 [Epulopiscium sp. Nuni2H_MBin001]
MYISNNVTFTGLASGLDTTALVDAIVSRYQSNYDNETKQQMLLELKLEKYKEVNSLVLDFYDNYIRDLRLESTFNQTNTTVTNTNTIDLVSGGSNNDIIEILQTATPATVSTESILNNVTTATTLGDIGIEDEQTITINNTQIALTADMSVAGLVDEINNISGVEANWSESTSTFSINFATAQLTIEADTDVLNSLGISTEGATYNNGVWEYSDQVKTSALTKTTQIDGNTTLSTLGIAAGSLNVNGNIIEYDTTTTIDDMLELFKSAGVDATFEYSSDNTSGQFILGSGFTIANGGTANSVADFIDSKYSADENGQYTFDNTITTSSLSAMGSESVGTDTFANDIKLTDLGLEVNDVLIITTTSSDHVTVTEETTVQAVLNLFETSGVSVSFNAETLSFEFGDNTDFTLVTQDTFEILGITEYNGIKTESIKLSKNTNLEIFGINSGSISVGSETLQLDGANISEVLALFNDEDGITASFNYDTNQFEFTIADNVDTVITSTDNGLQQLGFDTNAINLTSQATSETIEVANPNVVTGDTTLYELGYDINSGLSVNGEDISISNSTTVDELVASLREAGVNVRFNETTMTLDFILNGDVTLGGDLESLGIDTRHNTIQDADNSYTFTDEVPVTALERVNSAEITTSTTLSELGIILNDDGSYKTITVNGENVSLSPTATIAEFLENLNSTGINAAFDSTVGAFQFSSTEGDIVFGGDTSELAKFGISANDSGEYIYEHQEAIATYNGMTVTSNTNTFNLQDIIFIAKNEGTATINVTADIDSVYNSIEGFVNAYNNLIEELNTLLKADSNSSYMPLLDSEKSGMSDYEISLWNDKIDSSLLSGDSTLQRLLTGMRTALQGYDSGAQNISLSEIGITTSSNYSENGKLYIDEDILRNALTNNLQGVSDLFTGSADTGFNGIIEDMYEHVNGMFMSTAGSSAMSIFNDKDLETAINKQQTEVDKALSRLEAQEAIYTARFLAMELSLQKLSVSATLFSNYTSDSSWLF